jgi:MoaA/NifB/PqqE/SkfB family radical SAM enzyme
MRNLADARRLGCRIVDFTGGEPLLYEKLPEVLRFARRTGLLTTVTTNGLCYPERAGELKGLITFLQFSLEGPDETSHDFVKGNGSYQRVRESIEIARSLGEEPTFGHTVTNENIERVPEVIAFARRINVLLFLNPCFSYFGNPGLSPENANLLGDMAKGWGVTVDRGFLRFVADGGNHREDPRCLAVSSTVVISPDDRLILPCYHFKHREIPIEGRLFELRKNAEIEAERSLEGRHPFCEGCAVNCYIRASLYRRFDKYFLPSVMSGVKYAWEYVRMK